MDAKALLIFAVIGIVAGFIASLVVGGGGGLLYYLIIGVIGAFVGGILFSSLKINIATGNAIVNQIITSAIGAIIVVFLARLIA
ncbi:MAG: GlsB/YeaQ/YmgE family stress response membrane protein [Nitratireductor sp.]|nr:GlsB/YeaQ/YmgE family stress response membrane protein [Nitratireductor sp.]MCC0019552.1 GlsB/YeaQ/YmgE family stress response membrane protein [Nitratireductor sp.]